MTPPVEPSRARAELPPIAALTIAYWTAVVLVDARGDFPLNDDWGYAPAVRALVEEGVLRFTDWQSMPLLTHVLWGALFCLPDGFSYEALRLSTLVAGWLGVLAMYGLGRQLRAPTWIASVAAALLFVNPIYFGLAHTFMTDVPFVATIVGATFAWIRAEEGERTRPLWLAVALSLALWATLNRQLGIAVPLGWAVVAGLRHGLGRRFCVAGLLPAVVVVASLIGYERVIDATVGLPSFYHQRTHQLSAALQDLLRLRGLPNPVLRTGIALMYLGLFTAPLTLVVARRRRDLALAAGGAALGLLVALLGVRLPFVGNILIDLGMGPRTAPGFVAGAGPVFWTVLTALAGAGAGLLLSALWTGAQRAGVVPERTDTPRAWLAALGQGLRSRRSGPEPESGRPIPAWQWLTLFLIGLIAFAPTSVLTGPYFDRYLLTQLPFVLLLGSAAAPSAQTTAIPARPRLAAATGLVLLALAFSSAATHDHLAWQRTRWEMIDALVARGVSREHIRGGFEADNRDPRPGAGVVSRDKAPWAVSLAPLAGSDIVERVRVDAWLPASVQALYVMHRPK